MQRGISRQKGFTILEVMFAAAVMALAIASSVLVMGRGLAHLDSARCIGYASQIMQGELERMRLTPWGNGTAAGTGTPTVTIPNMVTAYPTTATVVPIDATFINAGDIGSRMRMTRVAADVHPGMIQITLTISWTSFDGRSLSRSYVTYYAKNGLYDGFTS